MLPECTIRRFSFCFVVSVLWRVIVRPSSLHKWRSAVIYTVSKYDIYENKLWYIS